MTNQKISSRTEEIPQTTKTHEVDLALCALCPAELDRHESKGDSVPALAQKRSTVVRRSPAGSGLTNGGALRTLFSPSAAFLAPPNNR
jgi:hypothetical protein